MGFKCAPLGREIPPTIDHFERSGQAAAERQVATRQAVHVYPFGTYGLRGGSYRDLVRIVGPCGEGHTMNRAAAAELVVWLQGVLAQEVA